MDTIEIMNNSLRITSLTDQIKYLDNVSPMYNIDNTIPIVLHMLHACHYIPGRYKIFYSRIEIVGAKVVGC